MPGDESLELNNILMSIYCAYNETAVPCNPKPIQLNTMQLKLLM